MIEEAFTVDGTPDIEVRLPSGRIELKKGETGVVKVTAETNDPGFSVEQRGDSIVASSDSRSTWATRGSTYLVIETPEGSDLYVGSASARVDSQVRLGKVEIKTASGDVELEEAEVATVKSASGDVRVGRIAKSLRFSSASGHLDLDGHISGSLVASTASGDVRVNDSDAVAQVNTASGSVYITRFAGKSGTFKSMSGSVDIRIPRGTSVDLDVNLLSGRLYTPEPEESPAPKEREMTLRVKLVTGDLSISRA